MYNPGDIVVSRVKANIIRLLPEQGQNSKVYLAHDPQLDCEMILKEIRTDRADLAATAITEARKLQAAQYKHVAVAHYAFSESDASKPEYIIRIAMPNYSRGSLNSLIENGAASISNAIRYTQEVALAVNHIHSLNLVHADIKPSNIFINQNGEAVLADFGQATYLNPITDFASAPPMYPLALPPEMMTTGQISKQADIYLLGLTLYRLLNGKKIWDDQYDEYMAHFQTGKIDNRIASGLWPMRDLWLPHIPASLRKVILKAMHPDLTKRFQNVNLFANALSEVASKIDERLLYCEVEATPEGWVWTHRNAQQVYTTTLRQSQNGGWDIDAKRKNTLTNDEGNVRKHITSSIAHRSLAFGRLVTRFENP